MNYNLFFWIGLISLTIVFGSVFALTLYVRSNYSEAIKKMSSGKHQEALDLFMRVVGWQTRHVPALWQTALLHLSIDKPDAAVRYLEKIIKIMDSELDKASAQERWEITEARALSKLAWTLSKMNKRNEAIVYFRRLAEFEPKNTEVCFELAKLLYTTRQHDQAISALEHVIKLDPAHADAYETLSHALSAKGQHKKSAEALAKRLELDRNNVNLWIRLANLYRTAKENAGQTEAWKMVMDLTQPEDPNHISAMVQLGKLAYLESNYEKAIDRLERVVTRCPAEDVRTLKSVKYYLGMALLKFDRRAAALRAFSDVYTMDPNYKDVRDQLRESLELLSDDDIVIEIKNMRADDYAGLAASISENLGYRTVSVETVSETDIKIRAKLEETGKDRAALLYFQKMTDIDVGELVVRAFAMECDEKRVEFPYFFTPGGFTFEAQLRAKDYRLKLVPKREFCEFIRKVRTAA